MDVLSDFLYIESKRQDCFGHYCRHKKDDRVMEIEIRFLELLRKQVDKA